MAHRPFFLLSTAKRMGRASARFRNANLLEQTKPPHKINLRGGRYKKRDDIIIYQ